MRRSWFHVATLAVIVVVLLGSPTAAFADACDDDPTCFGDDSGMGIPGWFTALAVLFVVAAIALTIYRVTVARGMAEKSGMDPGDATRVALLDDDGLSATYLASQVRGQQATTPPAARSTAERLRELDDLRAQGLVTEEEHAQRRAAILGDL
jgi:hypothetical protein